MSVAGEAAALNAAGTIANNLGIFGVISKNCGYVFYRQTKREDAIRDAEELFSLAVQLIHDLPTDKGFKEAPADWLWKVMELVKKCGRLVENMDERWEQLGANIDQLKRAHWYHIALTSAEFTCNSQISSWRFHKIGRTSAKVSQEAARLKLSHKEVLKGGDSAAVHKDGAGYCDIPIMKNMNEFIALECRAEKMGRIRSSIHNHSSNFTQIYGPAGIGKTTMLANIAQDIEHDKNNEFTKVVYVEVSRSLDIFQIQKKIAVQIGQPLKDTEIDMESRAAKINIAIRNTGYSTDKVLIVLDDVWGNLEMADIGIQSWEKVKVVIGTRMNNLRWHHSDDKIPIELLTGNDPWIVFKGAAGLNGDEDFIATAEDVAKECFGLPLALAVIGNTLRGEDVSTWENALRYLKKSKIKKVKGKIDVEELLCKVIQYSYDYLDTMEKEDKIARHIFRLCCLFPENHDIPREDLKNYLTAEHPTLASNDFNEAILSLLKCHLLKTIGTSGILRMHAVVRDVAVYITKEKDSAFIHCGAANSKTELSKETVTSKKTVSVMKSKIKEIVGFQKTTWYNVSIPTIEDCAKVQTLLLRQNLQLTALPDSFFQKMDGLTVLDLSYSPIKKLPDSIKKLRNVRTLLLNGCKELVDVGEIAELPELLVLSLRESAVTSLQTGYKCFKKLIVLDLSDAEECTIQDGFFSGLGQLKELFLPSKSLSAKAFMDIIGLKNIKALRLCVYSNVLSSSEFEIKFVNREPLPENSEFTKWSEFAIFFKKKDEPRATAARVTASPVPAAPTNASPASAAPAPAPTAPAAPTPSSPAPAPATPAPAAPTPSSPAPAPTAPAAPTPSSPAATPSSPAPEAPASDFTMSQKKKLHIMELTRANRGVNLLLREAENIIIEECFQGKNNLDFLTPQGEKIFERTKSLHLKNCGTIQYLSSGGSSEWGNLEELELTELKEFEGIFTDTVSDGSFAKVREITFRTCDNICCVMPNNVAQKVHAKLQKIKVFNCHKVDYIFQHYSVPYSVLKLIDLRGLLNLTTIWKEIRAGQTFENLKELIVMDCHKLDYVFTTTLVAMLGSLQILKVENNQGLKAIVQWNGNDVLNTQEFPNLTHLSIQTLANLEYFHGSQTNIDLVWPSLVQLRLGGCNKLARFPIGQGSAPHMTRVDVTSENDKPCPWYTQLERTAQRFKIRVAYDLTEDV